LDDVEKEDESLDVLPDFMKPDEDDTDRAEINADTEDKDKADEE
jgi:hypothetical protein